MASGSDPDSSSHAWYSGSSYARGALTDAHNSLTNMPSFIQANSSPDQPLPDSPDPTGIPNRDVLLVLLPLLIVLSSLLFLLLLFLVCVLLLRRRRGISLKDNDGPIDMSREELIDGEDGFESIEERWLESANEDSCLLYRRAKDFQTHYPPNSLPTDITLSQFLSIQEKGVSAWSFEPDYESNTSVLVHARTEITFLPDPLSSSCVQSNLPLPKLNEVYYWEVKMFDLPEGTNVAIGLATKPYPPFRLPGHSRFSVAYHSNGDKSHNYPFMSQSYGSPLKEGDVLGVGYRPRTGTVFFTRNGRKMDDAYIGLTRWNLFPTAGADGPCSLHVNLGQAGFVFIEANVKKWGLAPSVGTLAPPPAYGAERGSILLEAGGGVRPVEGSASVAPYGAPPSSSSRRYHRSRRVRTSSSAPPPSPLRNSAVTPEFPLTPPPPISPIEEGGSDNGLSGCYISPTDVQFHTATPSNHPLLPTGQNSSNRSPPSSPSVSRSPSPDAHRSSGHSIMNSAAEMVMRLQPPPESPMYHNEPVSLDTIADIHLRALTPTASQTGAATGALAIRNAAEDTSSRPPPAYSPLDAYRYSDGVQVDLPAEVIAAALEGGSIPAGVIGMGQHERHRSNRRERRR